VHYKIYPAETVTHLYFNIQNIAKGEVKTVDSWLEKWVELSPHLDNRWGGYWTLNQLIMYFVGNKSEAMATFGDSILAWKDSLSADEKSTVVFFIKEDKSYFDSRDGDNMTTDKTGMAEFNIASRLIPRDWVVNNPTKAVETLRWLVRNGFYTFNYILGGAVTDIPPLATAVHPAMRKAIWQIETFSEKMIQKLRNEVNDTAPGFNHASKNEPDWRNAFWGPNLNRLQELKQEYDPNNRFNCWHCIGYQDDEASPSGGENITMVALLFTFCSMVALTLNIF